jgi:hypothetical protein
VVFYADASGDVKELALGASGTFLKSNGAGVAPSFAAPSGSGDMLLGTSQTVTAAKTFLDTTFLLRNVANTFNGSFVNTNTANRVYTLKDASGTIAFTSDITGTNSGTNTGDNAVNSLYSGLVSNATHTGDATGATALTLATVNSNVGSFGSATQAVAITVNGKGLVTAASASTITPATRHWRRCGACDSGRLGWRSSHVWWCAGYTKQRSPH